MGAFYGDSRCGQPSDDRQRYDDEASQNIWGDVMACQQCSWAWRCPEDDGDDENGSIDSLSGTRVQACHFDGAGLCEYKFNSYMTGEKHAKAGRDSAQLPAWLALNNAGTEIFLHSPIVAVFCVTHDIEI